MADHPATTLWNFDDDEGDLCRVCRSEAEDSKPLIYPCKCSGSVRYVHSDCLQEWLSHSRKRYCEICGHHYTFTKVYPSSLPSAIPVIVYVRQSLFVAGRLAWRVFRICLAIVSWLVCLPCITMASLRIILAGANYITSPSLQYGVHSAILDSFADLNGTYNLADVTNTNATGRERVLAVIATNSTLNITPSFTSRMVDDAKNFMAFVFRGQIVAISIAAGLIGLILLREWIGQLDWNARPVVEETGELNPDEWVFRNGHALRLADMHQQPESNAATVDESDRAVDFGDNDTVVGGAEREEEPRELVPRPTGQHVEYAAPEQLEDDRRTRYPALDLNELPDDLQEFALAADRISQQLRDERTTWADVPQDAVGDPGPSTRLAWLRDASVPDDMVGFETMKDGSAEAGPSGSNLHDSSSTPELRRASDPGPRGREYDTDELEMEPAEDGEGDDRTYRARKAFPRPPTPARVRPRQLEIETADDPEPAQDDPGAANRPRAPVPGSESEAETVHDTTQPLAELARTDTDDLDTDADPEGDGEGDGEGDADQDVEIEDEDPIPNPAQEPEQAVDAMEMDGIGIDIPPEDDEERPLDADDWDGIFEVIGFIGPLTGLFHNHVFVSFAMACTLLILVGLPVAIGKLFLLWTDFRMIADVILGTLRLITVIVDIILDVTTSVIRNALIVPRKVVEPAVGWLTSTLDIPHIDLSPIHFTDKIFGHSEVVVSNVTELPPVVDAVAGKLLDVLEWVGGEAYSIYKAGRLFCVCIAGSPDVIDQFFCLIVGYTCVGASVVAVAIADAANLLQLSETVVEKARSVAMFLKVVFFMTLEIVLFPLFVGMVMDMSTLLLFGSSFKERLARMALRPFGSLFIGWLIGTVFMFSFATFLAHLRTICRRGALYFIRDPSDPSHSPVKDIIERPVLSQLPRLAISAVMYSLIAISICGVIPTTMVVLSHYGLFPKDFLPLRLDQRPLSSVPFDLLFLHLILPPTWESLRVYHRLKKGLALWWNFTVRWLELSSLILGVETVKEPQSKTVQLAWLVTDAICQSLFGRYDNRATRARVPASDRIELLPLTEGKREGMFIPLDHKGAPKTEADELRLLRQDRAACRAGRNPLKDYIVVSLPDYWRTRIHVLLGVGLMSTSLLVATLFFFPLAVGRLATSFLLPTPVFDGYSWLMGMYVCWGSFSLGQSTRKRIIQWSRAARLRRSGASTRFKRAVLGYLAMAYSVAVLYFILPLLVGTNFELYISVPVRYGFSSELTPVLHVWDAWAIGTAGISLYVGAAGFMGHDDRAVDQPHNHRLRDAFKRPTRIKPGCLNRLMLPIVVGLVVPIVVPWVFFLSVCMGLKLMGAPLPLLDVSWVFRVLYPLWSILFIIAFTWHQLTVLLARVRQWMIDAEYVLEERVENYEPEGEGAEGIGAALGGTVLGAGPMTPVVQAARDDDEWEDIADDARGDDERRREFPIDINLDVGA